MTSTQITLSLLDQIAEKYGAVEILDRWEELEGPDAVIDAAGNALNIYLDKIAESLSIDPEGPAYSVAYVVSKARLHLAGLEHLRELVENDTEHPEAAKELANVFAEGYYTEQGGKSSLN